MKTEIERCRERCMSAAIHWFTPKMPAMPGTEAGPKPRAGNSVWVSDVDDRNPFT